MENLVLLELIHIQNKHPFYEYYFYEGKEGYEVDFSIKKGTRIRELSR